MPELSTTPYTTTDPFVLGRLELAVAILAGTVLISSVWMLWITRDRRADARREAASNARLARRYGGPNIAATARRLLATEEQDEL